MNKLTVMAAGAVMLAAQVPGVAAERQNPFLQPYDTKYEIAPFDKIQTSDFIPAIKAGIAEQEEAINNIIRNRATPDFDNTILPLENLSPILERVSGVFYHYMEAMSTPEFAAMSEEAIPLLNDANNQLMLNDLLFQRIKAVYDNRDKLGMNAVQKRLVEKYYRQFEEQGAALPADKKAELVSINDQLSKLFIQFNRNLLNATNQFAVIVYDKNELVGLPQSSVAQAADEAAKRAHRLVGLHTARPQPSAGATVCRLTRSAQGYL